MHRLTRPPLRPSGRPGFDGPLALGCRPLEGLGCLCRQSDGRKRRDGWAGGQSIDRPVGIGGSRAWGYKSVPRLHGLQPPHVRSWARPRIRIVFFFAGAHADSNASLFDPPQEQVQRVGDVPQEERQGRDQVLPAPLQHAGALPSRMGACASLLRCADGLGCGVNVCVCGCRAGARAFPISCPATDLDPSVHQYKHNTTQHRRRSGTRTATRTSSRACRSTSKACSAASAASWPPVWVGELVARAGIQ